MAQSVRDKIIAAAVAALNAPDDKPATTFRTRIAAVAAAEGNAILLAPISEDITRASQNILQRELTIRLEIVTAGAPPQDAALDPIVTFATNTLANDATFLGFLKNFYEEKIVWEFAAGEQQENALAAIDFKAVYFTTFDPGVAAGV